MNMFPRLRLILTSILILTLTSLHAQSVKLSGRVTNSRNEPLQGATIVIAGAGNFPFRRNRWEKSFTRPRGAVHQPNGALAIDVVLPE